MDNSSDATVTSLELTNSATPLLEMNVAFAIFTGVLCLVDLFRSKTTPVWFEMIWTFVFGTLEIICIVIVAQNYPSAHCKPSSASPSLGRRDAADDSVIGQAASATSAQNLSKASKELCANWAAMVVLFTMIAVMRELHLSLSVFLQSLTWPIYSIRTMGMARAPYPSPPPHFSELHLVLRNPGTIHMATTCLGGWRIFGRRLIRLLLCIYDGREEVCWPYGSCPTTDPGSSRTVKSPTAG